MNINKKKLIRALYIYIALMLILIFSSKTIYNFSLPKVTVAMPQSGRLTKELEARGVITFSETYDIYAASSGQIDEMLIKKGDFLDENTVIATLKAATSDIGAKNTELSFNIERVKNQLASMALNKSAVLEKLQALNIKSSDDLYSYENAVTDAKTALERRLDELSEMKKLTSAQFDDYGYQQAIADAETDLSRKKAELNEAEGTLLQVQKDNSTAFDDYVYQKNINDAAVTLERKKEELKDAEAALAAAKQSGSSAFDDYTYQKTITTAKNEYDRSLEDYNDALAQYDVAAQKYYDLINNGADDMEIAAAKKNVDDSQSRVTSAKRKLDDANTAINTAFNDLARAENDFYTDNSDGRQKSVAEAERQVEQAKNAVDDAQRSYDKAIDELNREKNSYNANKSDSKQKAIDDAKKRIATAQAAVDDAERIYNRAVDELSRAAEKTAQDALKNLSDAEIAVTDAQTALTRAEFNLDLARKALSGQTDETRKSLELELKRGDLEIERANIDLRATEAALSELSDSDDDAAIITSGYYQGIVISIEKKKGQFVTQGEKIATIGVNNNVFTCEVSCSDSGGGFIEIGDEASIRSKGVPTTTKAIVYDIAPAGDTLKISLTCETEELTGGEYVSIKFSNQTEVFDTLVPNEVVCRESTGSYVWVIRSRQGALGTEYYSIKVKVLIVDSDEYFTAVSKGLEYFEPVVVSFNKSLSVNGRVNRLE